MTTLAFEIRKDCVSVFADAVAASIDDESRYLFEYPEGKTRVVRTSNNVMLAVGRGLAYVNRQMARAIAAADLADFDAYHDKLRGLLEQATRQSFQDLYANDEGASFPDARLNTEFYLFGWSPELDSFSAYVIRNYGNEKRNEPAYNMVKITKLIRHYCFKEWLIPEMCRRPELRIKTLADYPRILDKRGDAGLIDGLKWAVEFNRSQWMVENGGKTPVVSGGKIWKTRLDKQGNVQTTYTGHNIPLLPGFEVVAMMDHDGKVYGEDPEKITITQAPDQVRHKKEN